MKWLYRLLLGFLTLLCPVVLAACYGAPYEFGPEDVPRAKEDVVQPVEEVQILEETATTDDAAAPAETVAEVADLEQ
jgi:hypothetical protein